MGRVHGLGFRVLGIDYYSYLSPVQHKRYKYLGSRGCFCDSTVPESRV